MWVTSYAIAKLAIRLVTNDVFYTTISHTNDAKVIDSNMRFNHAVAILTTLQPEWATTLHTVPHLVIKWGTVYKVVVHSGCKVVVKIATAWLNLMLLSITLASFVCAICPGT